MVLVSTFLFFIWIGILVIGFIKTAGKEHRKKGIVFLAIGLLMIILQSSLYIILEYNFENLWASQFNSQVFSRTFNVGLRLFLLSFLAGFLFTIINAIIAVGVLFRRFNKYSVIAILVVSVIAGLLAGFFIRAGITSQDMLLLENGLSFGINDPILGKDVSFYIYRLPILNTIQNVLSIFLFIFTVITFAFYGVASGFIKRGGYDFEFARAGKIHFIVLLAGFMISQAWGISIERLYLVADSAGVRGINYVMPTLSFSIWLFIISSLVILFIGLSKTALKRSVILNLSVVVLSYVIYYTASSIYPAIVQSTAINTNEFAYEKRFIEYKIKMTRWSYGIDKIRTVNVDPGDLTRESLENNQSTINNIRLHDYRAAHDVVEQLQRFRPYYRFTPIGFDQYVIDGQLRQVMTSAREIDIDRLPENARTWINKHFVYTHGYGIVAFPVNEFSSSGEPVYAVKDIPMESKIGEFNPRIYYGLYSNEHVYVNTNQQEFDYAEGEQNRFTTYTGKTGINVNQHKFLVAWHTDGFRLYFTNELKKETRLLYRRNIMQRVKELYPFLLHTQPYTAVVNGKLVWIIDSYTSAANFPYAASYKVNVPGYISRSVDYFRNSVKIVIDAYDGTVKAYIVDKSCPIIRTWQKIFPTSFEQDQPSAELRSHFKYPETILELVAQVFSLYHVTDPQVFYNREDVYQVSDELYYNIKNPYGPYYQICRLPGQSELRLNLMTMFIPAQTQIVRGLMSATLDTNTMETEVVFYSFPKTRHRRDGVMQFLARIDQTPSIKEKLTLWGNRFMGNMLVYPLLEKSGKVSLLYVQPVYIRSTNARFPQIKMIIVGDGANRISWGFSFNEAVSNLLSESVAQSSESGSTTSTAPINVREEVKRAFNDYLKYLRENNFVEAGKALQKVKMLMQQL